MRTQVLDQKVHNNKTIELNNLTQSIDDFSGREEMTLKVQIPFLRDDNLFGLELVDTPGVDEAGCASVALEINRIVSESSVILYLLNCTSIGKQADIDFINLVTKVQVYLVPLD